MIYNVYCVRDVVADDAICLFYSSTDGMAVRDNLPALSRVRPVGDLKLYRVGTFDSRSMVLESFSPVYIDWDVYKFPEVKGTPAKSQAPEVKGTPAKSQDPEVKGTPAKSQDPEVEKKVDNVEK